jgi:hypothetical protein
MIFCVRQDAATEEQRVVVLALLAQYIRRLKLSLEEVTQRPHVLIQAFSPALQPSGISAARSFSQLDFICVMAVVWQEYYRICDEEAVDDVTALRHANSTHDRMQIRCARLFPALPYL